MAKKSDISKEPAISCVATEQLFDLAENSQGSEKMGNENF